MKNLFLVISLASLCSACITSPMPPSQDVADKVTLCNAGSKITLSAYLKAKIEENIKNGLDVTTGIERDLKGYYLNNAKVQQFPLKLKSSYNHRLQKPATVLNRASKKESTPQPRLSELPQDTLYPFAPETNS